MNNPISFFQNKISQASIQKVIEVSDKLGILSDWLLAVMYFESKLNPQAINQVSGSVGLIQFTRDKSGVNYKTINGKKYLLSDLQKMSFSAQMDVVYEYLKPFKSKMSSFEDVYLTVFFPLAVGKFESYVLKTSSLSANLIASQNKIFDLNKDGQITKKEFTDFISNKYLTSFKEVVKKKIIMQKLSDFWNNHQEAIISTVVGVALTIGVFFMFFKVSKKR